jgi:hypothetical protein
MAMAESDHEIPGRFEKTGFAVVEQGIVQLELTGDLEERFERDPADIIRRFLRERGFDVNQLTIDRPSKECKSYHIVSPREEYSRWWLDCG